MKATVFGVLEDLTFRISEGSDQNWADSGQLQFWSQPSEILNVKQSPESSNVLYCTPKKVLVASEGLMGKKS